MDTDERKIEMTSSAFRASRIALATAGVVALVGCSPSIVQSPASPEPSETTEPSPAPSASEEPTDEPTIVDVRNPYEAGALPDWSVEIPSQPDAVVYDRQSGTLVAVVDDELLAYEVTNSGRTLERWSYPLPGPVMSLDATNGRIYLSIGTEVPDDFIILHAARGTEQLSWVQSNPLDSDAPLVVGMYDDGLGVIKLDRNSVVAAIINNEGDVIESSRVFYGDADLAELVPNHDLVPLDNDGHLITYAVFPELETVTGTNCYSLIDGLVCTEPYVEEPADDVTETDAEQSVDTETTGGVANIVEYDRSANPVRRTVVPAESAAVKYDLQSFNEDTTVRELARALAAEVDNEVVVPAILSDGEWVEADEWASTDVTPLAYAAPFAANGEGVINLLTGDSLGTDGATVVRGAGSSDSMFFEWDGTSLTYLRPLG